MSSSSVYAAARLLAPLLAASFLQACGSRDPEQHIDNTKETAPLTKEAARAANDRLESEMSRLKKASLDGKGQVFYQGGIGIVYAQPLKIIPSEIIEKSYCKQYHKDWTGERSLTNGCEITQTFMSHTSGSIQRTGERVFVNAPARVVCPDIISGVMSLTGASSSSCTAFEKSTQISAHARTLLAPQIAKSSGDINSEALKWARQMP